ncbi:MAG TPA: phage tail protein [Thermoanaerobaculia bacterium]
MYTIGILGEVRAFASSATPENWLPCDGRLVGISKYSALFSVIGIAFGGDGRSTFGIPDLRGKIPVHPTQYELGGQAGLSGASAFDYQDVLAFNVCVCFDGTFPSRQ